MAKVHHRPGWVGCALRTDEYFHHTGQLVSQIQGMVGKEGAEAIQQMIAGASKPASGIVASNSSRRFSAQVRLRGN